MQPFGQRGRCQELGQADCLSFSATFPSPCAMDAHCTSRKLPFYLLAHCNELNKVIKYHGTAEKTARLGMKLGCKRYQFFFPIFFFLVIACCLTLPLSQKCSICPWYYLFRCHVHLVYDCTANMLLILQPFTLHSLHQCMQWLASNLA